MQLDKWNSSYTIIHVQVWFLRPVTELSPCFISLQKLKADVDRILSKRKLLLSNALQHVWMTNKIVFIYMVLIKFSFPSTFELEKKKINRSFQPCIPELKGAPLKLVQDCQENMFPLSFFFFLIMASFTKSDPFWSREPLIAGHALLKDSATSPRGVYAIINDQSNTTPVQICGRLY